MHVQEDPKPTMNPEELAAALREFFHRKRQAVSLFVAPQASSGQEPDVEQGVILAGTLEEEPEEEEGDEEDEGADPDASLYPCDLRGMDKKELLRIAQKPTMLYLLEVAPNRKVVDARVPFTFCSEDGRLVHTCNTDGKDGRCSWHAEFKEMASHKRWATLQFVYYEPKLDLMEMAEYDPFQKVQMEVGKMTNHAGLSYNVFDYLHDGWNTTNNHLRYELGEAELSYFYNPLAIKMICHHVRSGAATARMVAASLDLITTQVGKKAKK